MLKRGENYISKIFKKMHKIVFVLFHIPFIPNDLSLLQNMHILHGIRKYNDKFNILTHKTCLKILKAL